MTDELYERRYKREVWLQQFGKAERDILTDEVGDEYICLKTLDSRCTEAKYLPDGLQHIAIDSPSGHITS